MKTMIQTIPHIRPVDVIAWKLRHISAKDWDKFPLFLIAEAMSKGMDLKEFIINLILHINGN